MKISYKIAGGYALLTLLLLCCGGVGYYVLDVMSRHIAFISGPAWNTADGAMEGSIEIEAQMIAARNITLGVRVDDNRAELEEARERGDEAIGRMLEQGLIEAQRVAEFREHYAEYKTKLRDLLTRFEDFDRSRRAYFDLHAETSADCRRRADAGDAFAERQLTFLRAQLLDVRQLLAGDDASQTNGTPAESSSPSCEEPATFIDPELPPEPTASEPVTTESVAAEPTTAETTATKLTTTEPATAEPVAVEPVTFPALESALESLRTTFQEFRTADETYQADVDEFLELVAEVEEEADGEVEIAGEKFLTVQHTLWQALLTTLAVGVVVAVVASVVVMRGVMRPIRNVVRFSEAVAAGDLTQRLTYSINDEIGRMTVALNQAVAVTERAMNDVQASAEKEREARRNEARLQEREREVQADLRRRIDNLLEVTNAAADGDLTRQVAVEGDDALAELAAGIRKMLGDLHGVVAQIMEGAEQFSEGSRQIAETAQALAGGAEQQRHGIEGISVALDRLTQSVQTVRTESSEADGIAQETDRLAQLGGSAVRRSIDTMTRIAESSDRVKQITDVIAGIASQTNMLALNAAIEAARAGAHGRGFAVVAEQVRTLSEHTSNAVKQITALIGESTERIQEGVLNSREVGSSLEQISTGVRTTASKIAKIAASTSEQAQDAAHVGRDVASVSQTTDLSASSSEELASSSEELGAHAASLRNLVHRFRIDRSRHNEACAESVDEEELVAAN